MSKHLYEVRFSGKTDSRSHNYKKFRENATNLNGKTGDFAGIQRVCVISHHMDEATVHVLVTDGFDGDEDEVAVEEITKKTLRSPKSAHRLYTDLIENYFLPNDEYPNIE